MKRFICFVLALVIIFCNIMASATDNTVVDVMTDTAEYVYKTVQNPGVSSIGGEWTIIGLSRSGADIPREYYDNYYSNVETYVTQKAGKLHRVKYTEYSRVIIALTAIGKDPTNVAGYNLLYPLADYEKTVWQGVNGSAWALIALDSGDYEIPYNAEAEIQATREMYVEHIVNSQMPSGGWSLAGDSVDADITAMALIALANYRQSENVEQAICRALLCMSELQSENGGFLSGGTETSESCAQMICALCTLGIGLDDFRFVKNGNTVLSNLITYYTDGEGFRHTHDGNGVDFMSSEQALCSLAAIYRAQEGYSSLYNIREKKADLIETDVRDASRILQRIKFRIQLGVNYEKAYK